jgi:hypothetical protein
MGPIIKIRLEFYVKPGATLDQHEATSYPVHRLWCRYLTSRVTEITSVVSQTERATVQTARQNCHIGPCFMHIMRWMHKEVPIRKTVEYLVCIQHKCLTEVANSVVWQKYKIIHSAHAVSSFREYKWRLLHPTPSSSCETSLVRKFFISSCFMNYTRTTDTNRVLPSSVLTRPNTCRVQRLKSLSYFVTLTSKLFTYVGRSSCKVS